MNTLLYKHIAVHLRANVLTMKHIDLYNEQYKNPAMHNSFQTPAIFLEFVDSVPDNETMGIIYKASRVRVHCVMTFLGDTANIDKYTELQQASKLAYYDFPKLINGALQGFEPESATSAFDYAGTEYDSSHKQTIVEILDYTFSEVDDSAFVYKNYIEHVTNPKVEGDIVEPGHLGDNRLPDEEE